MEENPKYITRIYFHDWAFTTVFSEPTPNDDNNGDNVKKQNQTTFCVDRLYYETWLFIYRPSVVVVTS
jgi:hypothetical protein